MHPHSEPVCPVRMPLCVARTFAVFAIFVRCCAFRRPPPKSSATRLDGTTVTGELREWDDKRGVDHNADGDQRIATRSARFAALAEPPPTRRDADKNAGTRRTDRRLDPPDQDPITVDRSRGNADARQRPAASDGKPLTLADRAGRRRSLPAVGRDRSPSNGTKFASQNLASDVLVVLKRDGKSLDYVEGVLGDITDDKVEFKLDGETQRVDRARSPASFTTAPSAA